jgi:2-haloacid dehalogenase
MKSEVRVRRQLILAALLFLAPFLSVQAQAVSEPRFKVIAFDAFPIFDPRPIADLAEETFPGKGSELMNAWRARQFEYQWLRALAEQYVDFLQATEEGLVFAARSLDLDLTDARKDRLMSTYRNLSVWPDAVPSVKALREAGFRLVFLSNMTEEMLENGLEKANLRDEFEAIYSTDAVRSYKPARKAYQIAVDGLDLSREEILFVAFAGWDAAGAEWFGYPTYWVNRLGSPREELGVSPDAEGPDLKALVEYVTVRANSEPE